MPKNLGLYNDDLSTPRKKDVDACYGPNNAPPYPVTSVNGQTGGVNLTANDVGADASGVAAAVQSNLDVHTGNTDNPHQVTAAQVGAISSSEKGTASGVATLGTDGKVPESQLPAMDYAPSTHASQHASDGSDPITPSSIGAAASYHNHSASNITSGTLGVARGGTGKSSVTSGNFLVGNGTKAMTEKTPAQVLSAIGAAASSHNQAASTITAGTFAGNVIAGSSYQAVDTALLRNSKIVSSDTTPSNNGEICWTYA